MPEKRGPATATLGGILMDARELSRWTWGRLARWAIVFLLGALAARGDAAIAWAERLITGQHPPPRLVVDEGKLDQVVKQVTEHVAWADAQVREKDTIIASLHETDRQILDASRERERQLSELRSMMTDLSREVRLTREDVAFIRGRLAVRNGLDYGPREPR